MKERLGLLINDEPDERRNMEALEVDNINIIDERKPFGHKSIHSHEFPVLKSQLYCFIASPTVELF